MNIETKQQKEARLDRQINFLLQLLNRLRTRLDDLQEQSKTITQRLKNVKRNFSIITFNIRKLQAELHPIDLTSDTEEEEEADDDEENKGEHKILTNQIGIVMHGGIGVECDEISSHRSTNERSSELTIAGDTEENECYIDIDNDVSPVLKRKCRQCGDVILSRYTKK
jgi:uncharacterized membrane protein YkoI